MSDTVMKTMQANLMSFLAGPVPLVAGLPLGVALRRGFHGPGEGE